MPEQRPKSSALALPVTKSALTQPLARYSHGRWAGDLFYLAGQGCRDPLTNMEVGLAFESDGSILKSYDIATQTRGVFKNIERVLSGEGLSISDVVDISVYLVHMSDFAAMNQEWNKFFEKITPPCRTTIGVRELPGLNFIEMKAVAARSGK